MGRAPCCDKTNVKRGPWSPEEDAVLRRYIELHGTGGNWIALPQKAGLRRCGKSCRLRWLNYLRPDIKHGGFTEEEDNIIFSFYKNIGSRWSVIASQLPGRTDNDVKNYWNTKLKKKIMANDETNAPAASTHMAKFHQLSRSPESPPAAISQLLQQPRTILIPTTTKTEAFLDGSLASPPLDFHYTYPFDSYHLPQLPVMGIIGHPNILMTEFMMSPPPDDVSVSAASSSVTMDNSSGAISYKNWNGNRAYIDDASFLPELGFSSLTDMLGGGFSSGTQQSLTALWSNVENKHEEVYQSIY